MIKTKITVGHSNIADFLQKYQNVEHFNRLFKKAYNMTPMQFRNQK